MFSSGGSGSVMGTVLSTGGGSGDVLSTGGGSGSVMRSVGRSGDVLSGSRYMSNRRNGSNKGMIEFARSEESSRKRSGDVQKEVGRVSKAKLIPEDFVSEKTINEIRSSGSRTEYSRVG